MISYQRLRVLLASKNLKWKYLKDEVGINSNIIAKLNKDQYVSLETLVKIAIHFGVDIGDLVSIQCSNECSK